MKQVSVMVPVYNQVRFVAATLDSVLAQSYPYIEVIVVDDGSTDDTPRVLETYAHRVQIIQQVNRGLAGARNTGYLASRGEYLLFLDSDDLLHPDMIARHVSFLEAYPDFGLCYCAWQQISEDGTRVLGEVHPNEQGHVLAKILRRTFFFFASGTLLRRAAFERAGLFDDSLRWGEDADLWLRLAHAGFAFGYIDQALLNYRIRAHSMTASVSPKQVAGWLRVLDKFFADPDLPPEVKALEAEAHSILHYETAGRYFRDGAFVMACDHLRQAARLYPSPDVEWLLEWIAGTALDPRTRQQEHFINMVLDHLVVAPEVIRTLRRRAHGRYHTAAAFAASNSRDWRQARKHIVPALVGDPAIIRNRGFLRVALASLLGRG